MLAWMFDVTLCLCLSAGMTVWTAEWTFW